MHYSTEGASSTCNNHYATGHCKPTPSNCSCLHVSVRNVVYLHKNRYRSAGRRQQVPVKFQLHTLTRRHRPVFRRNAGTAHCSSLAAAAAASAASACMFPCARRSMHIHDTGVFIRAYESANLFTTYFMQIYVKVYKFKVFYSFCE